MDERLYTLDEARKIIGREKCRRNGHDLEQTVIRDMGDTASCDPIVHCIQCGHDLRVIEHE